MSNSNQGFFLKELRLTGIDLEPAIVTFKKGLNVISGPSDTGKTFIFQCIEFLLGRSRPPKNVPEARKYTKSFLQIQTYLGKNYTLERSLKGGDFKKYDFELSEIDDSTIHEKFSEIELSDFLLSLGGMKGKKARKNQKGETKNITFRVLHNFFLLDEIELQSEMSPIQKEQYVDKTYLENVFKYLLTGQDDGDIIVKADKNTVANRKVKMELLNEFIASSYEELSGISGAITEPQINSQLDKLNNSMTTLSQEYAQFKKLFDEHYQEKKTIEQNIREKQSRIVYLEDLLKRADILSEQYVSDIARLRSTIETSLTLSSLDSSSCPMCHSKLESKIEINMDMVVQSSHAEIEKITALFNELIDTKRMFNDEKRLFVSKLEEDQNIANSITEVIEHQINNEMTRISNFLNLYGDKKADLSKAQLIMKRITQYEFDKTTIEKFLDKVKDQESTGFIDLDVSTVLPLLSIYEALLKEINFPNLTKVSYSERLHDFVINEKNRQEFGKGYRAITYAAFIVSLIQLLKTKTYQIGLAVFDSPLVTYKKPKMNTDDLISVDLAENFYHYLAQHFKDIQMIVIENTPPPNGDTGINHIEFTKNDEFGRYGFIPHAKKIEK